MNRHFRHFLLLALLLSSGLAVSQTHYGNWLCRTAIDTTIVRCYEDSLTHLRFPPGSMGMMFPDSLFCRISILPLDSIPHSYDSTIIGWCRITLGTDSVRYDYMNCYPGGGGNSMRSFMRNMRCSLYWDSLQADSSFRHWRPTGVLGWTGTGWVSIPGVDFNGNTATFSTSQVYSGYAFAGAPAALTPVGDGAKLPTEFSLSQNYPNPFNPGTTIRFILASEASVTLIVFDALGQVVSVRLERTEFGPGEHTVEFDATSLASGIYYYRLMAESISGSGVNAAPPAYSGVRKMLLIR